MRSWWLAEKEYAIFRGHMKVAESLASSESKDYQNLQAVESCKLV